MTVRRYLIYVCLCLSLLWALPALAAEQVAPGVRHWQVQRTNWEGKPLNIFVLEVDPKQKFTEIRPVLGNDVIGQKETLSSMAQRTGAVAAINGGFFDTATGVPVGNLFIDGRAEYISDILRTTFAFTYGGEFKIGYLVPQMKIEAAGVGDLPVKGINLNPVSDGLVLYTQAWGKSIPGGAQLALKPDADDTYKVVEGSSGVPAGGYVLVGWGSAASQLMGIRTGSTVKVVTSLPADWSNLRHGLSGSPILVENGLPVDQAVNEGLWGSVLKVAPRTALGVTAQGKVLLVVIDGRQEQSAGVTLEELSYIMIDLGAVRAVALDGGGSSEIWVKGQILNSPSDKKERPLGNGLMIIQQMPVYVDGQRLYLDVAPLIEQGRTLVPMRKIFERLGAEISWDEVSKTVVASKGEQTIELTIGNATCLVNGKQVKLDVPAKIIAGRTLVPLRFVGETLGAKVNYVTTNGPAVYIEGVQGGSADE